MVVVVVVMVVCERGEKERRGSIGRDLVIHCGVHRRVSAVFHSGLW